MRLEQENDDLAHELVTSKIALRNDLDQVSVSFTRLQSDRDELLKGEDRVALPAVPLGLTLYLTLSSGCLLGEGAASRWQGTACANWRGWKTPAFGNGLGHFQTACATCFFITLNFSGVSSLRLYFS